MSKKVRIFVSILFVFCCNLTALAAVYTVSKTADTNDGLCDADCSLREAVAAANSTAENDNIAFSALFDTAQLITLSGTEIVIANNGSLTINGPGANLLTISGNNASRIFSTSTGGMATINNAKFTAGNGVGAANTGRAGAIYNNGGNLTLNNLIITGNTANTGGGTNNAGTGSVMTVNNCIISNNTTVSSGGGMQNFSTSTLNVLNSTISGNTSGGSTGGGAIQANGTLNIANSTFSGNNAPGGSGGAIAFNGTAINFNNVTISQNISTNNGGGFHRTGSNLVTFRNTIIAGNNGTAASPDITGSVTSNGNNIVGNVGTSLGWITTDFQNIDPILGPFADNGGFGNTYMPLSSSPAINAGQNCVVNLSCASNNPPIALATDQRGLPRPSNGTIDIGAVEAQLAAIVTISGRVVSPGFGPIKNAIVFISNANGVVQTDRTNSFGNFKFSGITSGQNYTLNVFAKQYSFAPRVISVNADITDIVIDAGSVNFAESKY